MGSGTQAQQLWDKSLVPWHVVQNWVGWHHWLSAYASEQTQGDNEGKSGVLKFMGAAKSRTWPSNWTTTANVESSCTRDSTCVPCVAGQILYHWITRVVPWSIIFCIWVRKITIPSGMCFIFNEETWIYATPWLFLLFKWLILSWKWCSEKNHVLKLPGLFHDIYIIHF